MFCFGLRLSYLLFVVFGAVVGLQFGLLWLLGG